MRKYLIAVWLLSFCALSQAAEPRVVTLYVYHLKPPFIVDLPRERGLYYDFADFLNSKGGAYRFRTLYLPRNRIEHELEQGELDGVLLGVSPVWFRDKDEEKYLWTPPMYQDQDEIVSRVATAFDYQGPESLAGKSVGGVLGFTYFGIDQMVAQGKVARRNTVGEREVLQMVLKGRVDVGIVSRSTLDYLSTFEGLGDTLYRSAQPHDRYARRMLVPRHDKALYDFLSLVLRDLDEDGDWQAILARYR